MTPQEFESNCIAIRDRKYELEQQIQACDIKRQELERRYVQEIFEASGYKIGQKIQDIEGRTWFISGARECNNHVYLNLNPAKKDGTMSKTTYIARGEPRIKLN